ncbi:butyrophilin subfamily 1 member A1-like [Marmota monax]|uniref:butyrophilin subfamily 1 member A1-like n=1 Tax=Marmota monax TaxID=9995 RepID=UPI0026EBAF5C|nr:butyrophilin subfamily 1 member A1-like [Marmota monax]
MAVYIPEPFFPQASPWKPAFAVILTMLGLLLLGACYCVTKEHSRRMQMNSRKISIRGKLLICLPGGRPPCMQKTRC